jgi:glycosyltransferase involved in cell wall biosynthesis
MGDTSAMPKLPHTSEPPTVSIIIPAYNVAPYIAETLNSVIAQTYPSWEAIVVNDGSTDTLELQRALAPFQSRITYISQENKGAGAARNAAIRVARGEWLAFLDGDDYWAASNLESQLTVLRRRNLDMVWSDGIAVGNSSVAGTRISKLAPCVGEVTIEALILATVNIPNSGTMVRRSCVDAVGGIDETIRRGQDFDLWVRLLNSGVRAGYHGESLLRYRMREGSLTGDTISAIDRELNVLRRVRDKGILSKPLEAVIENRLTQVEALRETTLGKRQLEARQYGEARRHFLKAHQIRPTRKMRLILALLPVAAPLIRRLTLARTPADFR